MLFAGAESVASATETIDTVLSWVRLGLETAGALAIASGGVRVLAGLFRRRHDPHRHFNDLRLLFARYLSLALEFQLASDIIGTAMSPTWMEIGELAAIATIRTALNYFLSREMRDERERMANGVSENGATDRSAADRGATVKVR